MPFHKDYSVTAHLDHAGPDLVGFYRSSTPLFGLYIDCHTYMAHIPQRRYGNSIVTPASGIDASVFGTLKMLNMIADSIMPQLENGRAHQAIIPKVGTDKFYQWVDTIMTQPSTDLRSQARRRVHVLTRHLVH